TSDHGDCLGDHGLNQKWTCYEQITRMPLVLWGPGRVPAGKAVDALVQQQDVVPWLFDVAGIAQTEPMEVESLAPALTGGEFTGREAVYCEQGKDRFMSEDFMTMVRTNDWKLVHYLNTDQGQLFDLKNDPLELKDLWQDAGARAMRAELTDRLMLWRLNSQLATSEWTRKSR
ncbi:MAG: sulfatase/phosphatase domain-containing protein, partial [Burkholderiaceae bacterium]